MRIKKYQNWKLATTLHPNTTCSKTQKISDIFSICQLLLTPKKTQPPQDEHQLFLEDPKPINHNLNINRKKFTKQDIQLNLFIKPVQRAEREQLIKNKIKQRIKEQFSVSNLNKSIISFSHQDTPAKLLQTSLDCRKTQPKQSRVFIKGNSLALSSVDNKIRSQSTFHRKSLPKFNRKEITQQNKMMQIKKQKASQQNFLIVEIKRRLSSSLGARQKKTFQDSSVTKKDPLKQIQPWEIDQAHEDFCL